MVGLIRVLDFLPEADGDRPALAQKGIGGRRCGEESREESNRRELHLGC